MRNKKLKVIGGIVLSLVALVLLGLYIVDFLNDRHNQVGHIMLWLVIILLFFNGVTWGNDAKAGKDEMGQQIKNKSGKISYHILTTLLFVIWWIDNLINEPSLSSVLILSAFCIGVIIHPIVQLFIARRILND